MTNSVNQPPRNTVQLSGTIDDRKCRSQCISIATATSEYFSLPWAMIGPSQSCHVVLVLTYFGKSGDFNSLRRQWLNSVRLFFMPLHMVRVLCKSPLWSWWTKKQYLFHCPLVENNLLACSIAQLVVARNIDEKTMYSEFRAVCTIWYFNQMLGWQTSANNKCRSSAT